MTPADHGYIRCIRCGTWRQPEWLTWDEHDTSRRWCDDVRWCSAMAGQGRRAMEADTGERRPGSPEFYAGLDGEDVP